MNRLRVLCLFSLLALSLTAWCQLAKTPWPKFRNNGLNTGLATHGGSNGSLNWVFQGAAGTPVIGPDDTIYLGSDDNNVYALYPDGSVKWTYETDGTVRASPALGADGTIYVGSSDNKLYALNPNGQLKWSFPTQRDIRSSAAIGSDGTIYVGSSDHYLYAVNPSGQQIWRFQTGSSI